MWLQLLRVALTPVFYLAVCRWASITYNVGLYYQSFSIHLQLAISALVFSSVVGKQRLPTRQYNPGPVWLPHSLLE